MLVDGTTVGSGADYECSSSSRTASDVVYRFVAPRDGVATVSLTTPAGYDGVLYAGTGCPTLTYTCLDSYGPEGTEAGTLDTISGQTYYIVVDGYDAFFDSSGPFTLVVSY